MEHLPVMGGTPMANYIGYARVSTESQTVDQQTSAINAFIAANGGTLVTIYVEVISGKSKHKQQLEAAIKHTKKVKGKLLVAKIDRLSRNAIDIFNMLSNVDFISIDNPTMSPLTIKIMAIIAEEEKFLVSARTREKLQELKRQGIELGRNGKVLAEKNKADAMAYAEQHRELLTELNKHMSATQIAKYFNDNNIPTSSGNGKHHPMTIIRTMNRLELI